MSQQEKRGQMKIRCASKKSKTLGTLGHLKILNSVLGYTN